MDTAKTIQLPTQYSLLNYNEEKKSSPLITDIAEALTELPDYSEATVKKLMQVERGSGEGKMKTLGLALAVKNTETYEMTKIGLIVSKKLFPLNLEECASHPTHIETPLNLEIEAVWDNAPTVSGDKNNILGDNGRLILNKKNISVPIVKATNETLAYYGATLIEEGECIRFPDAAYPLFKMNVGNQYVSHFINSKEGGGFYLEYHNDQPHFHMPIKGGGYYLLAKWNEDKTRIQITAFQIPDGKAVYTRKGAIHCDAALTGDLLVGYTISKVCSTVLLRTASEEIVTLEFVDRP
jgi:hypothetical protein